MKRIITSALLLISLILFPISSPAQLADQAGISEVARLELTPAGDMSLKSSEQIIFSAIAFDAADQPLENVVLAWSLESASDSIGFLTDSVFTATRPGSGRIKVTADTAVAFSGVITVGHGDLSRIFLNLAPEQLAGQPLVQSGEAILFDFFYNLVTDYDLAANPLVIHSESGNIIPGQIDSNAFQVGGVVQMLSVPITHDGASEIQDIYVSSNGINSRTVSVSFSGYDILDLLDVTGETIHQVNSGTTSLAFLKTVNNGTLLPELDVTIYATYLSGGATTITTFTGSSNGIVDTIQISLPTPFSQSTTDDLRISVFAEFDLNGTKSTVIDAVSYPVTIVQPGEFAVAEHSFMPDSIYPGEPFDISFDVITELFDGPVDSTVLAIKLLASGGGGPILTLFDGLATGVLNGATIEYRDIASLISQIDDPGAGYYPVQFEYTLYSGNLIYVLNDDTPDSVFVLPMVQLSYSAGTLSPTALYAGQQTAFDFVLSLESSFPIKLFASSSELELSGENFAASSSFIAGESQLNPGDNIVAVQPIFIPLSQLGNSLSPGARIAYSVFSEQPQFLLETNFDNAGLTVSQAPVVQILSVDVTAPNSPMVNTLQEIFISCEVANIGVVDISDLQLELTSDGSSVFNPIQFVDLQAGETVDVQFVVTAAEEPNAGEILSLTVVSSDVTQLPPVDNTALMQVETPAFLVIEHELVGVEHNTVGRGQEFGLLVEVVNLGQATTGLGRYRLTSENIAVIIGNMEEGEFTVGEHLNLNFKAPDFDTVINFHFEIIETPSDSNSFLPAILLEDSFDFTLRVESVEADLLVTPAVLGTNLVLPGRTKQLFELELSNLGLSPNTGVIIDQIKVVFSDENGRAVSVSDLIVAGGTGFIEDGNPVTVTNIGGDEVFFVLNDFVIEPGSDRTLLFEGQFKQTDLANFSLKLSAGDIIVRFETDPGHGEAPRVVSTDEGEFLVALDLVVKSGSLQESFIIENNPFNPETGSARMTYELSESSAVEFRVFTLTGNEVYAVDYQPGMPGTSMGENFVEWDGRNTDGKMVLNGIYISTIKVVNSGDLATLKIALVK